MRAKREGSTRERTRCGDDTIGICRTMRSNRKASRNPKKYGTQYVDITINGKITRDMVDPGAKSKFMTKTTTKRFGLSYIPINAQLKMVNKPLTPVSGVTHGVSFKLSVWQGKTNFTIVYLHLFDIILGQDIFQ